MAVSFLSRDVSDLCLGKPALRPVKADISVAEAVVELKRSGESHVSVWSCCSDHSTKALEGHNNCRCIGKISMVDVIVFLCKEENSRNLSKALQSPVSQILPSRIDIVRHLNPNSSLLEAIDCILGGTQNLVIPIQNNTSNNSRTKPASKPASPSSTDHGGVEYCWLTQEDVARFLLNSIGLFSPLPTFTIESLSIINYDIMTVGYHDLATSALGFISRANAEQTSVAVIDDDNRLIGEISPSTLAYCEETVAAAIASLSAGDLMAFIDCGSPTDDLLEMVMLAKFTLIKNVPSSQRLSDLQVKAKLEEKNLVALLRLVEEEYSAIFSSSSSSPLSLSSSASSAASSFSSDEELGLSRNSILGRYFARKTEAITCYPWSSLAAVMIQALAHRANNIWVVEEDQSVVGTVTYKQMLSVFGSIANPRPNKLPAGLPENSFKK
ncbi:CBS domain-containing protein CBSX5-like isoform X2 [Ipomoea triloba]|uniref:CBS domain-containing protein CBSX5-like isoform X2 n=1 Tax=Ipomoea triloba TaxID=35885 RepID=UPI00125E4D9C|nr:CBS domain-containing protein CBSX5-like isoform X2 [Ipomoea triloba]